MKNTITNVCGTDVARRVPTLIFCAIKSFFAKIKNVLRLKAKDESFFYTMNFLIFHTDKVIVFMAQIL